MAHEDENPDGESQRRVRLNWTRAAVSMPASHADEVAITHVGDRLHIIFGAIEPPHPGEAHSSEDREALRIVPVSSVALTLNGFEKMLKLFERVASDVHRIDPKKE